jgi:hypothetical protein
MRLLNLFLLEAAFDDQPAATIYRARSTQLSEQELSHMLFCSFHTFADLGNVREYGLEQYLVNTCFHFTLNVESYTFLLPSRKHCGGGIL